MSDERIGEGIAAKLNRGEDPTGNRSTTSLDALTQAVESLLSAVNDASRRALIPHGTTSLVISDRDYRTLRRFAPTGEQESVVDRLLGYDVAPNAGVPEYMLVCLKGRELLAVIDLREHRTHVDAHVIIPPAAHQHGTHWPTPRVFMLNGDKCESHERRLSYEQIAVLAGLNPERVYSCVVHYPKNAEMVGLVDHIVSRGQTAALVTGTRIEIIATGNA